MLAPSQELKQAGCSYRVGFAQSEFGLQVRCAPKNGIDVIFDYFGQRFINLFHPLAKFPNGQRITIHLKARLVGNGRIPIVESKAAHRPVKCFPLVHIPGDPSSDPNSALMDRTARLTAGSTRPMCGTPPFTATTTRLRSVI